MSTTYYLQGERMDIKIGSASLPVAVLNIFDTIIIIVLIPIMESLVYPFLDKIHRSPSHLQRMGKASLALNKRQKNPKVPIQNGQSRDICSIGQKTQNEDKQNKRHKANKRSNTNPATGNRCSRRIHGFCFL